MRGARILPRYRREKDEKHKRKGRKKNDQIHTEELEDVGAAEKDCEERTTVRNEMLKENNIGFTGWEKAKRMSVVAEYCYKRSPRCNRGRDSKKEATGVHGKEFVAEGD